MTLKEIAELHEVDFKKLTTNEIKQIDRMIYFGREKSIRFNKKGHLIFEQRYPLFTLYISIISLIISIMALIMRILK